MALIRWMVPVRVKRSIRADSRMRDGSDVRDVARTGHWVLKRLGKGIR